MRRPTTTLCPVCQSSFQQPTRSQGGGKRTIYCSHRCRSLDWIRGNGAKRKATILKYESVPKNKEKKRERTRLATLAKYGLSVCDFKVMLRRQHEKCAGCFVGITPETARIDHDHKSNKVRGLLCNSCNWALGHVKDERDRLYQLAAYLELPREQPVVYLIGSLRNPEVVNIGNAIRGIGCEVVDNWAAAGNIADDAWREYSIARGRSYAEALESREATHIFYFDRAYLRLSDAVVLTYPSGKSSHLEFGYSMGLGKRGYVLMEGTPPERYDVMLQFTQSPLVPTLDELLVRLRDDLLGER